MSARILDLFASLVRAPAGSPSAVSGSKSKSIITVAPIVDRYAVNSSTMPCWHSVESSAATPAAAANASNCRYRSRPERSVRVVIGR